MKLIEARHSDDGTTTKYLLRTSDGHIIETGYYDLDEHIFCISSQVGCAMKCTFCASGESFIRNLTAEEMIQQVKKVIGLLGKDHLQSKRMLFSYMGMGEPFLNYEAVVESIKALISEFPNSRTTIATIGSRPDLIRKLARETIDTTLKLQLSLHAPSDKLRKELLPQSGPIEDSLEALEVFSNERQVMSKVNYVLIRNFNDTKKHALNLAELVKPHNVIVKLSKLNAFGGLEPAGRDKLELFEKLLHSQGIKTVRFFSAGTDVQAGCGQFRRNYNEGGPLREIEIKALLTREEHKTLEKKFSDELKIVNDERVKTTKFRLPDGKGDVRLRHSNTNFELVHKDAFATDIARKEITIKLDSKQEVTRLIDVLHLLNLQQDPSWITHKKEFEFEFEGFQYLLCLQHIENFAYLLEVEHMSRDKDWSVHENNIRKIIEGLGCEPINPEAFASKIKEYVANNQ